MIVLFSSLLQQQPANSYTIILNQQQQQQQQQQQHHQQWRHTTSTTASSSHTRSFEIFACSNTGTRSSATTLLMSASSSSSSSLPDLDYLDTVREGIIEAGYENEWNECVQILSNVIQMDNNNDNNKQVEDILAKAYNWKSWAIVTGKIARRFIKTIPPNSDKLHESIQWLQNGPLSLDDNTIRTAIIEYPNIYLIRPEKTYEQALNVAPEQYNNDNPIAFRELLLQDLSVLQCIYNCSDEGCQSECGNCWVTFQNK